MITHNAIEGFHFWKDAPDEVGFLRAEHRHIFDIRCWWQVSHNDRDLEIILQQHKVEDFIREQYGSPAKFGGMSCESIADELMAHFGFALVKCQVLEDGYGGATLSR